MPPEQNILDVQKTLMRVAHTMAQDAHGSYVKVYEDSNSLNSLVSSRYYLVGTMDARKFQVELKTAIMIKAGPVVEKFPHNMFEQEIMNMLGFVHWNDFMKEAIEKHHQHLMDTGILGKDFLELRNSAGERGKSQWDLHEAFEQKYEHLLEEDCTDSIIYFMGEDIERLMQDVAQVLQTSQDVALGVEPEVVKKPSGMSR